MKYTFILTLALLSYLGSYGQSAPTLPEITPSTPEAANLGRYGNVPINPATGQMSFTVPIHTIAVDGNNWPISFQYNYGGFIPEAKPSLSGWGWSLNAYASVTRVTRGLPDFHPYGYYGAQGVKAKFDPYIDNATLYDMPVSDFDGFYSGQYDSEVDKFIVNIGGNKFSFKLRLDNNGDYVPYFLSKTNYQVQINMQSFPHEAVGSFIVTDDKGIKYFFDDDDREGVESINPEHPYEVDRNTAWMLSKILYLNGQEVVFDYEEDDNFNSWDFSASALRYDGHFPDPSTGAIIDAIYTVYNDGMRETQMVRQILSSITFPKGRLDFTHQTREGDHNRQVFNTITLKDHGNQIVDSYTIDYEGNRDALTLIEKNGEHFFGFEYHGIHLPPYGIPGFYQSASNKPLNQDFYKFYNGTGNDQAISLGNPSIQANKSPVHNETKKGALFKIIYPTGGHSNILYEQNQVKKEYGTSGGVGNGQTDFNEFVDVEVDLTPVMNVELTDTKTFTVDQPVIASLYHKIKGTVRDGSYIRAYITSNATPNDYVGCYSSEPNYSSNFYPFIIADARGKIQPPDPLNPEECPYYPLPIVAPVILSEAFGPENCPYFPPSGEFGIAMGCTSDWEVDQNGNSGGDFWLAPGTYTLSVWGMRRVFNTELKAEIHLRYYEPPAGNGGTTYENIDTGGIRVKSISDYSENNTINRTTYDYNDEEGFSTAFENQKPLTVHNNDLFWTLSNQNFHRVESSYFLNSFGSLNSANGVPVYYKKISKKRLVTDGNGNSQSPNPEGNTVYEYLPPRESVDIVYPVRPRHIDNSGASQVLESAVNGDGVTVQETTYDFQEVRHTLEYPNNNPNETSMLNEYDENDDHPWSFRIVLKQIRDLNWDTHCYNPPDGGPRDQSPDDCHWNYKLLHKWIKYREVEKELYINETITSTQGVTTEEYTTRTGDSNYLPREVKTITSDNQQVITTFDYANNIGGESQYINMTAKNQISTPVQSKISRNGQLISQQKTNFSLEGLGYKPSSMLTAKGDDDLEERIFIEDYDGEGNITQVRKSNGEVISYLYGYQKNYVVAMIIGASHTESIGALPAGTSYHGSFQNLDGTSLENVLEAMRENLSNAQVTSYTYKPLIGVTSVTDSRGYTLLYEYNAQNRLELIKDDEGNLLEQYEYNFQINN